MTVTMIKWRYDDLALHLTGLVHPNTWIRSTTTPSGSAPREGEESEPLSEDEAQ
jgi:hypothetical protein